MCFSLGRALYPTISRGNGKNEESNQRTEDKVAVIS